MHDLIIKEPDPDADYGHIAYLNELQKDFKLNNIENRIIHRLVFDGTVPVAYGIVKKMAEAVLLVNPKSAGTLRARALRELMQYAEFGSKEAGCAQMNCFVQDPSLAQLLERKYGFIKTKDIVLVKNL